jgi:hypothetical protein
MSARYDMEATEPIVAQPRERVELTQVKPTGSVELRPLAHAGLLSSGEVA